MEDVYDNNLVFSEELMTVINHLYGLVSEMVDDAFIAFTDNDKRLHEEYELPNHKLMN